MHYAGCPTKAGKLAQEAGGEEEWNRSGRGKEWGEEVERGLDPVSTHSLPAPFLSLHLLKEIAGAGHRRPILG